MVTGIYTRQWEREEKRNREKEKKTGICTMCDGKGIIDDDYEDEKGNWCTDYQKCPRCNGTGKMSW